MNKLQTVIDFYKDLDVLSKIFFWGVIIIVILLLVFAVLLICKTKKIKKIIVNNEKTEESTITENTKEEKNIAEETIIKEDIIKEESLAEKIEPVTDPIEEEPVFVAEEHVMEYNNDLFKLPDIKKATEVEEPPKKEPFVMPTKPYERNVLREMSLSQTSPIGIVRPEDIEAYRKKSQEEQIDVIKEPEDILEEINPNTDISSETTPMVNNEYNDITLPEIEEKNVEVSEETPLFYNNEKPIFDEYNEKDTKEIDNEEVLISEETTEDEFTPLFTEIDSENNYEEPIFPSIEEETIEDVSKEEYDKPLFEEVEEPEDDKTIPSYEEINTDVSEEIEEEPIFPILEEENVENLSNEEDEYDNPIFEELEETPEEEPIYEEIVDTEEPQEEKITEDKNEYEEPGEMSSFANLKNRADENAKYLEEVSEKLASADVKDEVERTEYELKQEEDAIISFKELMERKDHIEELDEEDAVISIGELIEKKKEEEKLYNLTPEEENDEFLSELKKFRNDL